LSEPALAAPGSPDATFGTAGIVTTPFGGSHNAGANSVAIQSNGKIVVAGQTETNNADAFALARYEVTGALDTTFDVDGKVTTSIGPSFDGARTVAIHKRKIIAAGFAVVGGTHTEFAVARYKPNGNPDLSFSNDGKVTTPIASNSQVTSIAIQPDGRIIAAGEALVGNSTRFAVARYKENGDLDHSFSADGILTTPFGTAATAHSVAIQPNGKILVAGEAHVGARQRFAVARYKPNGTLDGGSFAGSFGNSGKVTTPVGPGDAYGFSIALQSNGKIVVAGHAFNANNQSVFALVRYNMNGALDNGFSGGKVTTLINNADAHAFGVAIHSNGQIVAVGQALNGTANDFALARYNSNGVLDTGFGTGGTLTHPINSGDARAFGVAIQSLDQKIVVAGQAFNGNTYDVALTRYDG
jgi:uncharacterized delta-60 repeat protein